jgi:Family of unknown function (DUF5719)
MTMPDSNDPTGQVFVEADDAPPETPEVEQSRGALRTATVVSGRVLLGSVAVGVLAVLVAAAILIPIPALRSPTASTVVTPVPTAQQLVCPGGLLRLASASGKGATTPSAIGAPRIVSAAVPGAPDARAFAESDAATNGGSAAPQLVSTPPLTAGSASPLVGAVQSETVKTDEFFGLSSSECTAAVGSGWLSGGATTVGRTTLLLLANPTAVAAVVAIQIFGETGVVTAPGMDGISVPAGDQRVLSLAGFAPDLASPVVHVTSTGGQVVASLEQSTVRGLDPGGVDFVGATPGPARTTVLPGVVVSSTAAMQSLQGQSGFDDLQTTLRVYLPSTKPATASITVLAENGSVTGKPIQADLQPGSVTDLPLDQLSDGKYTVIVQSKVPVLASVRISAVTAAAASASGTDAAGGSDFAWVTPAALLTSSVVVPIASGMTPVLHLENPSQAAATVTLHALSGADITTTVGAGKAVAIPVVAGRSYRMTGFTQLYASVSGTADGEVTSYSISPIARAQGPLRIYR